MSKQFHPLADGEVISIKNTCRVSELAAQIRSQVASTLAEWSDEQGVDGEALRFGSQGWEKGKIRLQMTIEFCPDDSNAANTVQSTTQNQTVTGGMNPSGAVATAFGATATQASIYTAAVSSPPTMIATELTHAAAPAAVMTPPPPPPTAVAVEDKFELGTMSDIDGAVNLNLLDESGDYADFDLSAAVNDLNIEELVASETVRPTLVEEVWSEINQPNWPSVGRN